ncbi:MAG: hypothetical protein IJM59_06090 [Proteobacteria bacterium]|nr:hypothetical protein [Pseudomonadota bacterium]
MKKSRIFGLCILASMIAVGCSDSGGGSNDLGKSCAGDGDCGGGYKCLSTSGTALGEGESGVCAKVLGSGEGCGFVNTFCGDGLTCVNGHCGTGGGQVGPGPDLNAEPGDIGSACTGDSDCKRGKCKEGVCRADTALGQACTENANCPEDAECHESICKKPALLGDDCRSSLVFCSTGVCARGVCADSSAILDCNDEDGDTIPDEIECAEGDPKTGEGCEDTDGDGTPDYKDIDSDGDTIPDELEHNSDPCQEPADSDEDGTPDYRDLDSDNNGIPDAVEGFCKVITESCQLYADTDGDGVLDSSDSDNDGDQVEDVLEIAGLVHPKYGNYSEQPPRGADCYNAEYDKWGWFKDKEGINRFGDGEPDPMGSVDAPFDCDGDTIPDYISVDSDGDTILDVVEDAGFGGKDTDGDGFFDRYDWDSDNDGLSDKDERGDGEFPKTHEGNTVPDFQNPDVDKDGLGDGSEVYCKIGTCGGKQVSLNTDNSNCGECGKVCGDELICISGKCSVFCGKKDGVQTVSCNGECVDPAIFKTDPNNCGECGKTCDAGWSCIDSACTLVCEQPMTKCDDRCVDLTNDYKNCGACGTACATTEVCILEGEGEEAKATCKASDADCSCPEDDPECVEKTACWGSCVDLKNDAANCGTCGVACEAGQSCVEGVCQLVCAGSLAECNGACVEVTKDSHNCGACGTVCETTEVCAEEVDGESVKGVCKAWDGNCDCADGEENCVAKTACWGACVDLKTDAANCGECGKACGDGVKCVDGACETGGNNTSGEENTFWSGYYADADGDKVGDATEYTAALAYATSILGKEYIDKYGMPPEYAEMFICDPMRGAVSDPETGVVGQFDFYFELPYLGKETYEDKDLQRDILNFRPKVSKLDVVFNLDTTNSMGADVKNLREKVGKTIIPAIRNKVTDSAFGVTRFDDFPTHPRSNDKYDFLTSNGLSDKGYGRADDCKNTDNMSVDVPYRCDTPFQLLGRPEIEESTVQANVNKLTLHHGGDFPESGYEALWQIVRGDDFGANDMVSWRADANDPTTFKDGSIAQTPKSTERWGGAQFRNSTMPVVVHVTDTTAHDDDGSFCTADDVKDAALKCKPYDPEHVTNAHYSKAVHAAYQEKGARVISIYDGHVADSASIAQLPQLINTSEQTNAVVPACAFKDSNSNWMCGPGVGTSDDSKAWCCTIPGGVAPTGKNCVLSYAIKNGNQLSDTLVDGVDALVKYAISQVAAIVKPDPAALAATPSVDTSCFIKEVQAFTTETFKDKEYAGYVAPPAEPEKSCNPVAEPEAFSGAEYQNGYKNFAIGTSSAEKEGAQLNFMVKAVNDHCAKPTEQTQIFEATIELIDPLTGMSFGERKVSIVVPGVGSVAVN